MESPSQKTKPKWHMIEGADATFCLQFFADALALQLQMRQMVEKEHFLCELFSFFRAIISVRSFPCDHFCSIISVW